MDKNKIFISYRQSDTQSEASRLKENLEEVFGVENVFFDIETLEPGLNFAEAIEKTIRQSAVVLVLIGENWTEVKDEAGNLRLFKEDDWVRREVAMALQMENTRVIPVLVKDAKKLEADQLPDNIKSLADYQWAELTIPRWRSDVERLVASLKKIIPTVKKKPDFRNITPPTPTSKPKSWWAKNYLWVLGILIVIIIIASLPEEDYTDDPPVGPGMEFSEENEPGQIDPQVTDSQINPISVHGNWILYLEGEPGSTLVISQLPQEIEFLEYNAFNVNIGSGIGYLEDNQMYFDYYNSVVNVNGEIFLTSVNNGQTWEGTITFPSLGASNNIALKRN